MLIAQAGTAASAMAARQNRAIAMAQASHTKNEMVFFLRAQGK